MFQRFLDFFRLYSSLARDPRMPARSKWLPWLALIYLIVPFDLVPDVLPLLGQVDDIGVIIVLLMLAINAVSDTLLKEHRSKHNAAIDIQPQK